LLIAAGGLILVLVLLLGQSPETPISAPEPQKGGAYSEALVGSISRLNPVLDFANQTDRDIDRLLYSGLIRFDSRGMPQSDLAESWSVSADATLYTFRLRPDAVWHDGQPVTSDDVIYTFSKMQDDAYPGAADLHKMWKKVNVIRLDELNIQFQLPEPFAPFMDYLAVGLLPEHLLRGVTVQDLVNHPFNLSPVGTGPFKFDRFFVQDGRITGISLVRNDQYRPQPAFLERVDFQLYADSGAALQALLANEVQGIQSVSLAQLPQVLERPDLNVYSSRLPIETLVFLNTKAPEKEYIGDKKFRQALLHAINRQALIDQVYQGQGIVAVGPILPGTWAFNDGLSPVEYDPDLAGSLLESLGYGLPVGSTPGSAEYVRIDEDEEQLSLELAYPDDPAHESIARLIQGYWQAVGIETDLEAVPAEQLLTDYLDERDFEAVLTEVNLSRSPDPDPYPFWHDTQAENGQNYSGLSDRNSSIWLEQARTTPDYGRRADLYRSFQHRFLDQLPALPLFHPVYNTAVSALVQGIRVGPLFDPSDRLARISEWYTTTGRKSPLEATAAP
jgi:peptide/nickel transport system substrate-binding protein